MHLEDFEPDIKVKDETFTNKIKFIRPSLKKPYEEALPDTSDIQRIADEYYSVLVSLHAPQPDALNACNSIGCNETMGGFYSCEDCTPSNWHCKQCMVEIHKLTPFHRVCEWSVESQYQASTTLANLGLKLHLLHEDGSSCTSNGIHRTLQVLHINGLHQINYYQCGCKISSLTRNTASTKQLIANRLFPATNKDPSYAFTFQVMNLYNQINLEGYVNIKQFCDATIGLTPESLGKKDNVS